MRGHREAPFCVGLLLTLIGWTSSAHAYRTAAAASNVPPFLPRSENQRGIRRCDEPACPPPSPRDGPVPSGVKNPNTSSS